VRAQPWYGSESPDEAARDDPEGTNSATPEATSVFLMAGLQYCACALIFSMGHPWKQSVAKNRAFVGWVAVVALTTLLLFLAPADAADDFLSLYRTPYDWNLQLLGWSLLSFAVYFAHTGLLHALRRAGAFSARVWCGARARVKTHKRLRRQWAAQFTAGGGEARGGRWAWLHGDDGDGDNVGGGEGAAAPGSRSAAGGNVSSGLVSHAAGAEVDTSAINVGP
jgi:hypothetical protein